jgi:hypothetical protein
MAGQDLGGRYVIQLLSTTGKLASVEFRIRLDTVEVWHRDRCQAVLDRESFQLWLDRRYPNYVVDDVMWKQAKGEPTVLVIRDSGCWLIPAPLMSGLRARV